jgi:hypothetical protein
MRIPIMLRVVLVALIALISVDLQSAHADTGGITLVVYKGGWIIGGRPATARSASTAAAIRSPSAA